MSKGTMPRHLWNQLRLNRTLEEMAALTDLYRREQNALARWKRAHGDPKKVALAHARLMQARDAWVAAVKATA